MLPLSMIAHYRITAKLGEGGMGEVWRATDTRLNREVAIKILPDAFAQDAGRLARFAREAQVLASLNHSHIAAIYGVEERALVLELVEGATLSERIAQGAIPPKEGFHNSEIANHARLSPRMAKECVHELLLIYDVSNRTELVGLLALESSAFSSYQQ
jgi:serine/threonine protein kinase